MIILGIDPGTAILGWGVIEKIKSDISLKAYDAILTSKELSDEQRLVILFEEYNKLLETYKPDVVSIEELFFSTNVKTAMTVAQARGIILLASAQHNVPIQSYSPSQVKKTITGDGKADKRQIQFMLTKLLPLKKAPQPDDISDAIAIALTHAYTNRF